MCGGGCRSHLPEGISQGSQFSKPWLQHSWCLVRKDSRPLQQKAARLTGRKAPPAYSTHHSAQRRHITQPATVKDWPTPSTSLHPPATSPWQSFAAGWSTGTSQRPVPSAIPMCRLSPPVPPHHHPGMALCLPSAAPSPAPKVSPSQRCLRVVPDVSGPMHAPGFRENGALRQHHVSGAGRS